MGYFGEPLVALDIELWPVADKGSITTPAPLSFLTAVPGLTEQQVI
jgi:hypothetical protein